MKLGIRKIEVSLVVKNEKTQTYQGQKSTFSLHIFTLITEECCN